MPFTPGNDTNIVQATNSEVVSAGAGDDLYVLAPNQLTDGQQVNISDTEGVNTLKLVGGLSIVSSKVASDTAQLTLSNDAVVTLSGASMFNFNVGGTSLTGGVEKDFATFAQETLGVTVPAAGEPLVEGGTSNINADGTADVEQPVDPGQPGQDFTLTADAANPDVIAGTDGNDTFDASEVNSLEGGDQIIDNNADDTDKLNAEIDGNVGEATIKNIEEINLNSQTLGAVEFNAGSVTHDNVGGTTINVSSDSAVGTFGNFTVAAAGDNNVTAGENITQLDVNGLEGGVVDAGTAETVTVSGSAEADASNEAINAIVNGDLTLNVSGGAADTTLNLEATEASTVGFSGSQINDIAGSGEGALTLEGDLSAAETVTGVDTVVQTSGDSNIDASEWDVNTIDLAASLGTGDDKVLTVADGQNVELSVEQSDSGSISGVAATAATNTVNVSSDLKNAGNLTLSNLAAASIELTNADSTKLGTVNASGSETELTVNSASDLTITDLQTDADATLTSAGDVTLTALNTSADETITLNAAGNANITSDAGKVLNLDASGVAGALQKSGEKDDGSDQVAASFAATGTNAEDVVKVNVTGGQGDNNVSFAASGSDDTVQYTGFAGDDQVKLTNLDKGNAKINLSGGENTVNANALTSGTLVVKTTGGDTTVNVSEKLADGGVVSFKAEGAGDDTLAITEATGAINASGSTISTSGVETLELTASGDSVDLSDATLDLNGLSDIVLTNGATFAADQLSEKVLNVSNGENENASTLTVDGSSEANGAETIDLSGLTLEYLPSNTVSTVINGGSGDDTVTGTNADDSYAYAGGDDTITLGTGNDGVYGLTAGAGSVTITDFNAADDTLYSDGVDTGTALTAAFQGGSISTSDAATLDDAIESVYAAAKAEEDFTAFTANDVLTFEYDGDAYAVIESEAAADSSYDAADDLLITLQGVSEADLNTAIAVA